MRGGHGEPEGDAWVMRMRMTGYGVAWDDTMDTVL